MGFTKTPAPSRPPWESANWSVLVKDRHSDIGPEELVERVAAATGWSQSKTGKALKQGFPLVLGTKLTLIEALNVQEAAELKGVTAIILAEPH